MKILAPKELINGEVVLTASKSENNRALIIKALCDGDVKIGNSAAADDTRTLENILSGFQEESTLDVGPAGTTFRFLTAFLAIQNGEWVLTGSSRMKERPVGILVDALNQLGANISYVENEGYPPLKIKGVSLNNHVVEMDGSVSSQFVSALLLIAPALDNGLTIKFQSEVTSKPYIDMTLALMEHFGAECRWEERSIVVEANSYRENDFVVEADWSAASYWYQIVALSPGVELKIVGLKEESLQGDSALVDIYGLFGVSTEFVEGGVVLKNNGQVVSVIDELDLKSCPDLAQTVVCTCAAFGVKAKIVGLKTLRIKETDRSLALKTELKKMDVDIELVGDDCILIPGGQELKKTEDEIATYHDHRMAMAFAPLAIKVDEVNIENPSVVSKSYPDYWKDLESVGFSF